MPIDAIKTTSIEAANSASYASAVSSVIPNSGYHTHEYMRRLLLHKYQQKGHHVSKVYEETLRAMINAFSQLDLLDGNGTSQPVNCIYGHAERAVAKSLQEENIQLPIISVVQAVTENDDERRRYLPTLVVESAWNKDLQRAQRVISFVPRPVNIMYTVGVWTRYNEDMDQIASQIRLMFNPSLDVATPQSDLTKAFLEDEDNVSSFNVGDQEDRVIRKNFSVLVQTYVPQKRYLVTNTGKIEEFNAELDIYKC